MISPWLPLACDAARFGRPRSPGVRCFRVSNTGDSHLTFTFPGPRLEATRSYSGYVITSSCSFRRSFFGVLVSRTRVLFVSTARAGAGRAHGPEQWLGPMHLPGAQPRRTMRMLPLGCFALGMAVAGVRVPATAAAPAPDFPAGRHGGPGRKRHHAVGSNCSKLEAGQIKAAMHRDYGFDKLCQCPCRCRACAVGRRAVWRCGPWLGGARREAQRRALAVLAGRTARNTPDTRRQRRARNGGALRRGQATTPRDPTRSWPPSSTRRSPKPWQPPPLPTCAWPRRCWS